MRHAVGVDHAVGVPVFRHMAALAVLRHATRVGIGHVQAVDGDAAAIERAQAGQHFDQLALPVALDAGYADDLAGARLQRNVAQRRLAVVILRRNVLHVEHDRPRLRLVFVNGEDDFAADHHRGQRGLGRGLGVGFAYYLAVAQHNDAVADAQHFLELVRDEDDRFALAAQQLHHVEQPVDLLWRQDRCRLVQDEDIGVAVERLDNLDALAHADRQVFDHRVGSTASP